MCNGATGPQGVAGVAGPAGANGSVGATGPQGIAGVAGANGAAGVAGTPGVNGTNGTNGAAGATGATGLTGAVGPAGAAGATGPAGVAGPAGAVGATGLTGAVGPVGATGPAGVAGAVGPTGPTGTAGLNTLIKTTNEPAGVNCTTGGKKIETGVDANANAILEAGEVTASTYVCNGSNGSAGASSTGNGLYDVVKLHQGTSGRAQKYVVLSNGDVLGWGEDAGYGSLGDGTENGNKSVPMSINLPGPCREVIIDNITNYFLMQNGDVYSCGYNGNGELGIGNNTDTYNPTKVLNVSNVTKLVTTKMTTDNGGHTACALTTTGQLWCWGYNAYGQVGDGTTVGKNTPTSIFPNSVIDIDGGGADAGSFCAIMNDSTLRCWGYNGQGQLGIGNTTNASTPQTLFLLTKVKNISAVGYYNNNVRRCALRSNGDMYCWGYNGNGQVGDGSVTNKTSPGLIVSNVKQMALGSLTTYALLNTGQVYSWGYNAYGQVGNGTTTQQTGPTLLVSLSAIDTIACTTMSLTTSAFAIKNSGNTVYSWGYNGWGQLGNGTTANQLTPSIINLKNVKSLTSSSTYSDGGVGIGWSAASIIALLKDGGVKCWGYGGNGGIGNAMNLSANSPQLIKR
ncbi:MAG: hypothetical protein ABL940_12050 [Bacteroidia bacterium]